MRIIGEIDKRSTLGFVVAQLVCPAHNVDASVRFYVDTGATRTTIADRDAQRIGVDCKKLNLKRAPRGIEGAGGYVDAYLLPKSMLLFRFRHSAYAEYLDTIYVMQHKPQVPKKVVQNLPSVIGLDVLRNYSIKATAENIVMEK